jgi:hypothetical protein
MTSMLRMLMVGPGRAEPNSFYPRFNLTHVPRCERVSRASHATRARRRSGASERVATVSDVKRSVPSESDATPFDV